MNGSQTNQNTKTTPVPDPPDIVQAALDQALNAVTTAQTADLAGQIVNNLNQFLAALIPKPLHDVPADNCQYPDPPIAEFCAEQKLALAVSANTYDTAQSAASAAFQTALHAWTLAKSNYEFAVTTADVLLRAAVKTAVDTYNQKDNLDSKSRHHFLYFTLQESVAQALIAFEGSMGSAAATLAGAAGNVAGRLRHLHHGRWGSACRAAKRGRRRTYSLLAKCRANSRRQLVKPRVQDIFW